MRLTGAVQANRIDWEYVNQWWDVHGTRSSLDEIRASIPRSDFDPRIETATIRKHITSPALLRAFAVPTAHSLLTISNAC